MAEFEEGVAGVEGLAQASPANDLARQPCPDLPKSPHSGRGELSNPTPAEILADLARVKAVFQLRAIEAIIRGGGR